MNSANPNQIEKRTLELNLFTNVATVALFIGYSVVRRLDTPPLVFYLLTILFALNAILSTYLAIRLFQIRISQWGKHFAFAIFRIVANVFFGIASYTLIH